MKLPRSAVATPSLPAVLGLSVADGLPLHVRNRVGAAAGERLNVSCGSRGRRRWSCRSKGRDAPVRIPASPRGMGIPLLRARVAAIATATATMHETSFGAAPIGTSASRSSMPPGRRDGPPGSRTGRRGAGSPSGRRRTDTTSRRRAACRRSLKNPPRGNARRPHRCQNASAHRMTSAAVEMMIPSAAIARWRRVGSRASWP